MSSDSAWRPTAFIRYEGCADTSTGVARIITDAGKAYMKAIGNAEGPHALAREWVGTSLADWFGLQTLDFAIMQVGTDDEILLGKGKTAQPGPAFVTRETPGHSWSASAKELDHLEKITPRETGREVDQEIKIIRFTDGSQLRLLALESDWEPYVNPIYLTKLQVAENNKSPDLRPMNSE